MAGDKSNTKPAAGVIPMTTHHDPKLVLSVAEELFDIQICNSWQGEYFRSAAIRILDIVQAWNEKHAAEREAARRVALARIRDPRFRLS
jgi:hypothetical protein